ncbi:MAG: hypothetical protein GYB37_10260 [Algicola sp.]|nr:hypothetical protein [Algicola sp.]
MKGFKRVLIFLGILTGLLLLRYMVLRRYINPDSYFLDRVEPIAFNQVYVHEYDGSFTISAEIGGNYRTSSDGTVEYSINDGHTLYDDEYMFQVDDNNAFILGHRTSQKTFLLGKVVEKEYLEYNRTKLYTLIIPEGYKGNFKYSRGVFPYYEPVRLTMMTSGGMKYSSETITSIISPLGDTLTLYTSSGHINSEGKTGIQNRN